MCRWNPDSGHPFKRCRHGHRQHEELPIVDSSNFVVWCNECWTVCAYDSNLKVYHGLRALLSDLVYSPVHQTGEIFQGNVKTPSMSRQMTFYEFNQHRQQQEQQQRRPQISAPLPSRRNIIPSMPPGAAPDMRQQMYDAPLNFIPNDPGPSRLPSFSRRDPLPMASAPSYAITPDYRAMPLYRRQATSSGRRKVPQTPARRPPLETGVSSASHYPFSPGPSVGNGYDQSDFRQSPHPFYPQTPLMSPAPGPNPSANFRLAPEIPQPADFAYGYQQSDVPRQRRSPIQPNQPDYRLAPGYRPSQEYQRYQSPPRNRRNQDGWQTGYDASQGLL